jgi:hypothetical protein
MHVRQNLNAAVEPTSGCIANVELTIESDVSDLEIRVRVDEGVALWISELIVRPLQHDEAVEVDSLVTGLSD